jgi:hypothetical protein
MFAALEAIKNTLFSFNPIPSTVAHPIDTISSVIPNDNDNTGEPIIDKPEPIMKESEQADVYDKRPYTVVNLVSGEHEDFHYLHRENLAQTYDFCLNRSSPVKVHICMVAVDFQCNYSGEHLPFLRFLMEYAPSTIDFPKCEIMCMANNDNDDDGIAQIDMYFHNECKKRLIDFFVIEGQLSKLGDIGELLNKSYRGYKEIGEGEVVAVFDITSFLNIPLRTSANPVWMVLDDFSNQVLPNSFEQSSPEFHRIPPSASPKYFSISPKVLQFFRENEYMKQIRDPLNSLVESPKSLYLYDTANSRFMTKSEKSEWIEPRSFQETYGNFYYFKSLNIGQTENAQILEVYRKCVVFLKNYADFLENDESIALIGEHITEPSKTQEQQEEQKEESIGGNLDIDDLELSEDEEPEQYNYSSEYDKSEIHNNLPFVSLIMFSEKGEHMYCVKTESIFAEL